MVKLRIPTIQHLARNWNSDPDRICKMLVRLAINPPNFNYDLIYRLSRDMLLLGATYDDVISAINKVKRGDLREKYLEIMPLLRDHFYGEHPDYFQDIDPRYYSVGRGLMVPFAPPFMYGVDGRIVFPWLSLWRTNPLADERLWLFVTIVEEIMLQDPDLEAARFQIVDLSAPKSCEKRKLRVFDAVEIPRVSEAKKKEMLETFTEGFLRAKAILDSMPSPPRKGDIRPAPDPDQDDLFEDKPKKP